MRTDEKSVIVTTTQNSASSSRDRSLTTVMFSLAKSLAQLRFYTHIHTLGDTVRIMPKAPNKHFRNLK